MGGISINLAHLPCAGPMFSQPLKLMAALEVVKASMSKEAAAKAKRESEQ